MVAITSLSKLTNMADVHKLVERMLPALERQGWRWRYGTKHLVLYPADKTKRCFTVSLTPSDRYSMTNALKEIRKSGGII